MVYHSTTFMKVYYSTPKFGILWYNLPCIYHCVFRSIYPLMNLYHVSNVWNKRLKKKLHTHTKCFGCGIMFHNFLTTLLCLWNYYFRKILTILVANYIARSIIPITLQYCYRKDSCSSQSHLDYNVLYVCHIIKPRRGLNCCTYQLFQLVMCYLGPFLFIVSGLVIHPVFVLSSSGHKITQKRAKKVSQVLLE